MLEMKVRFPVGTFDKHGLFRQPVPQNYVLEDILKTDFIFKWLLPCVVICKSLSVIKQPEIY